MSSLNNINKYKWRFEKAIRVIKINPPEKKYTDCYLLASATALLLLVRAKYLFFAATEEDKQKNAYSCYVLVRAFFETAMTLGYLVINVDKKTKTKDFEGIFKIAHRIKQGGKYFPSDEFLEKVGAKRVAPINVYDSIDAVDEDMRRISGNKRTPRMHREVYDTVLSEFGHPNFLGLNICSNLGEDGHLYINLDKAFDISYREDYLNALSWGAVIFFHHWDKLKDILQKHEIKNLPDI